MGEDLRVPPWWLLVQEVMGAHCQPSPSGRSPAAFQHSSTGREALAAWGSCLISLCLEPSQLDALSSDTVWSRENKRHSCCVRGAQGAELSHSAARHVPLRILAAAKRLQPKNSPFPHP